MICRLNGPVRYSCARMGTAFVGVTMACLVACIVRRVPSHIAECVRSISRICLCKCSGASLRSTSSTRSSDNDVSSPVGVSWVAFSSAMAANMGPWNGSANPRMQLLRTMAWSSPKFQTLTNNSLLGFTSATPRATVTDLCRHRRMLGEMVTRPEVAQVATTNSSICPLTRTWRHALALAGWSSHDRPHLLESRVARIGLRLRFLVTSPTWSFHNTFFRRVKMALTWLSMNSVPGIHGTDRCWATKNRSKTLAYPTFIYRCIA